MINILMESEKCISTDLSCAKTTCVGGRTSSFWDLHNKLCCPEIIKIFPRTMSTIQYEDDHRYLSLRTGSENVIKIICLLII